MESRSVPSLPAVVNARPLVDEIIAIEKGKGFNLGGTLRTLTVLVGVLIGLMVAVLIGFIAEAILRNDGVAFFIFLIAAGGIGYYVWRLGRQLFPNVEEARRALNQGIIPLDDFIDGLNAREPGKAEVKLLESAVSRIEGDIEVPFSHWYIVPSSLALTYSFGDVLFVSREALESPDSSAILAHELGHLKNGDGYVRSAIWSLGKGLFGTQNISVFGSVVDDDEDGFKPDELMNLGIGLASKDWTSALSSAINFALTSSGKGVQTKRREIKVYFKNWDIQADGYAISLADPNHYLKYLNELEEFERGIGEGPFNAPAIHRFDAVGEAIETGSFPSSIEQMYYRSIPVDTDSIDQADERAEEIEQSLSEVLNAEDKQKIRAEIGGLGPNASIDEINDVLDKYDLPWI